jgi:membrane-associated HD superfamily phosphohydrolase
VLKLSGRRSALASLHRELGRRGGRPSRTLAERLEASWVRALLLVSLTLVLTSLFPGQQSYNLSRFLDNAVAREEVIAPESFYIYKAEGDYLTEVQTARRRVLPVFALNARLPDEQQAAVKALFDGLGRIRSSQAPDSTRLSLLRSRHVETANVSDGTLLFLADPSQASESVVARLRDVATDLIAFSYSSGLIESRAGVFAAGQDSLIVQGEGSDRLVGLEAIRDLDQLTPLIEQRIVEALPSGDPRRIRAVNEVVSAYLIPSLSFNRQETEARRAAAAAAVTRIKGTVLKGERIIDEHDRITPEHVDKIRSLVAHLNERRELDPYLPAVQAAGKFILSGSMVAALFFFLALFREPVYRKTSNLVLFGILLVMPAAVAHYAADVSFITPFLVPIALSAMLATVLFDAEVGFVVSVVSAAL